MREYLEFYIGGEWVEPAGPQTLDVINPANGTIAGRISAGTAADVDRAVGAARAAFVGWSETGREARLEVLQRIIEEYRRRQSDIADAITEEMGAPIALARRSQAPSGLAHFEAAAKVLEHFVFEETRGTTRIVKEPIGVCGLIMLVPTAHVDEAIGIAKLAAETMSVGDPASGADLGPVASQAQWLRIQELIASGIAQGATLVTGGIGRPAGLETGSYVKPTIFAHVTRDMRIAREEIFGPVLCISSFESIEEAIDIANDTEYGLAAYIWGTDMTTIHRVASQLRAGRVGINGVGGDLLAPFGGYKRSGNGREWGEYGFNEYLEVKAVLGYARATGT